MPIYYTTDPCIFDGGTTASGEGKYVQYVPETPCKWKHIEFNDGSNPYISMTVENWNKMLEKYDMKLIKETDRVDYYEAKRKGD